MATVTIPIADLYAHFKTIADLESQVAMLTTKLAEMENAPAKKTRKPKDPNAPTRSKFATEEERKEAYRQRALKAAATRKANREAAKAAEAVGAAVVAAAEQANAEPESDPVDVENEDTKWLAMMMSKAKVA